MTLMKMYATLRALGWVGLGAAVAVAGHSDFGVSIACLAAAVACFVIASDLALLKTTRGKSE